MLKAAVHHGVDAVPVLQHKDRLRAPVQATLNSSETSSAVSDREIIGFRSQVLLCWVKDGTFG